MDWLVPVLGTLGVGTVLAALIKAKTDVQAKRIDQYEARIRELIETQTEQIAMHKAEAEAERTRRRQAERRVEVLLRHIRDLEEWIREKRAPPPPALDIDAIWGDDE